MKDSRSRKGAGRFLSYLEPIGGVSVSGSMCEKVRDNVQHTTRCAWRSVRFGVLPFIEKFFGRGKECLGNVNRLVITYEQLLGGRRILASAWDRRRFGSPQKGIVCREPGPSRRSDGLPNRGRASTLCDIGTWKRRRGLASIPSCAAQVVGGGGGHVQGRSFGRHGGRSPRLKVALLSLQRPRGVSSKISRLQSCIGGCN